MDMSVFLFWVLLAAVGMGRLIELRLSKRNQKRMSALGAEMIPEPHFPWMVALHAGILIGAGLEAWLMHRPFIPKLAAAAGAVFLLANGLRWWVIRALSGHWNIRVMTSVGPGVVTGGPYRWIRHPNYLAVLLEMASLPLIHTAWLTAAAGMLLNIAVIIKRLRVEEEVLNASAAYQALMGSKARFIPWLF